MSATRCFVLFIVIAQLVDLIICLPVEKNSNAKPLMGYQIGNSNFRGSGYDSGFYGSNLGGYRPGLSGPIRPGFDPNTGYIPIGTGYLPPVGNTGSGFDPGFDGSQLGGGNLGGYDPGFDGSNLGPRGGGLDPGFDGSNLGGTGTGGGFDPGFDGSNLAGKGGSLKPNFDVRSG